MDSIWSIGVRYQGVLNVLTRYRELRRSHRADADHDEPADLVAAVDMLGGAEAFADAVQNHQRTSARGGVLKAEAVYSACGVLAAAGLRTPEDLRGLTDRGLEALRGVWTGLHGQGSGLSSTYFTMLAGLSGVKADRMVRRFVASALGVPDVAADRAARLVVDAAARLGRDARIVDYAIWRNESGQ
jgi:hypothetical protein